MLKKIYWLGFAFTLGEAITALSHDEKIKSAVDASDLPNTRPVRGVIAFAAATIWPVGGVVNAYRNRNKLTALVR